MKRRTTWMAALLLLAGAASAPAQSVELPLEAGARVRVHTGDGTGRVDGRVATWSNETIWLETNDAASPRALSFAAMRQIDMYRGRDARAGALRGAAWGAFLGLSLGGVTASAGASPDAEFGTLVAQRAAVGAAAGAVVGAGVGAVFLAERWQRFRLTGGGLR
jgi:hypothetical protein